MLQRLKISVDYRISRYHYRRLASGVEQPVFAMQQLSDEGYFSQAGQDKWVFERLFSDKIDGIFVDIGANNGITFSNTYFLEKAGWSGLAVEPIPSAYDELVRNRECVCVHGCIAAETGTAKFRCVTGRAQMLSGLVDEYDPRGIKRINREVGRYGGEYMDIEVNCYNLNEMLVRNGIDKIDYLSIDVEGAEYSILGSIDFERVDVSVIGVENNYWNYRIPRLLIEKGFEFHSIVGNDEFYRFVEGRA